jgi:hypothetical protein
VVWIFEFMQLRTFCAILFLAFSARGAQAAPDLSEAARILASLPEASTEIRAEAASRALLGRPYLRGGPLGENDSSLGDPQPRFRLDGFDCVTYLETSLALARARDTSGLLSRMDSIRYQDARVAWRFRNHFFEGDWLPRNSARVGLVRFPEDTLVTRRLDRREFYGKRGISVPDTNVQLPILWRDRAISRYAKPSDTTRLRGVALVGKVDGYPVLHTGFLVERKGAPAQLRHAAQDATTREQPFSRYLEGKTQFVGVLIWDILP